MSFLCLEMIVDDWVTWRAVLRLWKENTLNDIFEADVDAIKKSGWQYGLGLLETVKTASIRMPLFVVSLWLMMLAYSFCVSVLLH